MMWRLVILGAVLSACDQAYTAEGCPIYVSEIGRIYTESCVAGYYEEKARLEGKPVTVCRSTLSGISCVTD